MAHILIVTFVHILCICMIRSFIPCGEYIAGNILHFAARVSCFVYDNMKLC
jgi:hypothetical protein